MRRFSHHPVSLPMKFAEKNPPDLEINADGLGHFLFILP
jgi:hypothetical protein